ncbi:ABC transporter substrate-binding protein [Lichenihabitans sp. Uapishka_5]|uniref:ABC transporter substrate-binding protein n=1 Tax=Lichenihabitans sp. Uapishka_5 TaxID=3037302 RepID=UPI0029E81093|nr:ABC transporter substrate-binding protein [Lichenihabitans sp. Uapishka_5]MDX7950285.1 ABC transporter substrate-binding protein [Lichenihabitans sp. Uapishka_5]
MILTHGGALSNLPLFLAIDAGLLAARGLDVQAPRLDGFSSTVARLRNRTATIGTTGFTHVLADADDADPLVVVAGSGMRGMALLGPEGADVRTLSGAIGTFTDDPMQVLLADQTERHGLAGRTTVRFMGSLTEAADALASGAVTAITTVEPWIGRLVAAGATLLSDGSDVWGMDYPDTVLVARHSALMARPAEITALISAMLEAERMIATHPDDALAAVAHRFPGFSLAELRLGLAGQPPRVDLRGLEAVILDRWTTVRRLAGCPNGSPPSGLIDFSCLDAAIGQHMTTPERMTHVH